MPDQNILLLYCYFTPVQDNKTVNLLEDNSFANLYDYSLAHYMYHLYFIRFYLCSNCLLGYLSFPWILNVRQYPYPLLRYRNGLIG